MSKTCGKCGKAIETTGDGPGWMNEYQWDAIKAGDYYAACETPTHHNGNCYFWERSDGEIHRALSTPTSQP